MLLKQRRGSPEMPPSRTTHGMTGHKLHMIWQTMRRRCRCPSTAAYHCYGGRGIAVCDKWQSFEGFFEDMGLSWKDGLSLERIDVNGNYELSNCTWIPMQEQFKNKRPWEEWRKPKMLRSNTSGVKGVSWSRRGKCWTAAISIKKKSCYLGSFASKDEAGHAYEAAFAARMMKAEDAAAALRGNGEATAP